MIKEKTSLENGEGSSIINKRNKGFHTFHPISKCQTIMYSIHLYYAFCFVFDYFTDKSPDNFPVKDVIKNMLDKKLSEATNLIAT